MKPEVLKMQETLWRCLRCGNLYADVDIGRPYCQLCKDALDSKEKAIHEELH